MLKDAKLKAKIFCMSGGRNLRDVTRKYRYSTKLNEWNIHILENDCGMTYVIFNERIILKSITSFFKILYSQERDVFMFKTYIDQKEGHMFYELSNFSENDESTIPETVSAFDEVPYVVEEISGFEDFEEIEEYNLILLKKHYKESSIIYDYNSGKILVEEKNAEILWFKKIQVFLAGKTKAYHIIIPNAKQLLNKTGFMVTLEVLDEVLECKPVDECAPQIIGKLLINFSGKFAGKERVQIINKFSAVDNAHWLPEPYKYLVRMENELYMLGIVGEQFYMIPIEGKKIEPLFYPELPDYMIVTDDENVKIIKYNENIAESFELIAEYKGSEIKLSNPVLDIEEGCIKLPIKIVQERFLKECSK